jgi:DNA (cytosine-5)-methyltransferase 1
VDLVAAGYPCQPFSQAGKRLGKADPRHLWPEVARVVRDVRPSLVFLENVAAHVRLGLDSVLGDLASLGFNAEWTVLGARDVGAPHRRDRLWILAWRRDLADADGWRLEGERLQERGGKLSEPGSLADRRDPHGGLVWPPGPLDREAWERIEAASQPAIRGVADGSSSRVDDSDRLRLLGNGVVPLVAAHALRTLARRAGILSNILKAVDTQ